MPVPYRALSFLYPPRPSNDIGSKQLPHYSDWLAQRKLNGARCCAYISPDREVTLATRHRTPFTRYRLTKPMREALLHVAPPGAWCVLDGELLHTQTREVKDRLVLFDVLVLGSSHLIGTTYADRLERLHSLCRPGEKERETAHGLGLMVRGPLWLAETFTANKNERFQESFGVNELEGLVLKDPNGRLEFPVRPDNNSSWMLRVRRPRK